jgi:hypothetical protein
MYYLRNMNQSETCGYQGLQSQLHKVFRLLVRGSLGETMSSRRTLKEGIMGQAILQQADTASTESAWSEQSNEVINGRFYK